MIEITDALRDQVRHHEGVRTQMYLDSLGKATIGIGHLILRMKEKDMQKA